MNQALPERNSDYGTLDYWDQRYREEETYEWCKGYSEFKHLINACVNRSDTILILGCGNSTLGVDLYDDGYHKIVNVDYSSVVIDRMRQKYPSHERPGLEWQVNDIRDLLAQTADDTKRFPPETFDVVIDKCTLDVFFVNEKSPWTASEETQRNMDQTLSGVSRLLKNKPTSKLISITFTQPHFRKPYYAKKDYGCHKTNATMMHNQGEQVNQKLGVSLFQKS